MPQTIDHPVPPNGLRSDPDPTTALVVRPWEDPVIDLVGHDPRSRYVEQFWLPAIGPTAVWLLRALAWHFDDAPDRFVVDAPELSASLGLGRGITKNSHLMRTIDRCEKFGLVRTLGHQMIEARRQLPALSAGRVRHLPDSRREEHAHWQQQALERRAPDRDASGRLALALLNIGHDPDLIRQHLNEWGLADGDEAVRWAHRVGNSTGGASPACSSTS